MGDASVLGFTRQIGASTVDGLAYLGALASLGGRAAYYTFVGPFQGQPIRLQRSVSQAMEAGVRALPILTLITFFIGLILALQAAYELRRFGALNFVASVVLSSPARYAVCTKSPFTTTYTVMPSLLSAGAQLFGTRET